MSKEPPGKEPPSFFWLRDERRQPLACVAHRDDDNGLTIWAISIWNQGRTWSGKNALPYMWTSKGYNPPGDLFNRKLGREIATSRLEKRISGNGGPLSGSAVSLPHVLYQLKERDIVPPRIREAAKRAHSYLVGLPFRKQGERLNYEDYVAMIEGRQATPSNLTSAEKARLVEVREELDKFRDDEP